MIDARSFPIRGGDRVHLPARGGISDHVHLFSEDEVQALRFAIAARRPLLVRGEPGVGKSQLARAAAMALGKAFVAVTVDARTESRDLQWHFDAVERLADAQVEGAINKDRDDVRRRLAVENYLQPGPLWWAFAWSDAAARAGELGLTEPPQPEGCNSRNGVVLLVDEIDKAETDVPNGLLEALGAGRFSTPGGADAVEAEEFPLIIVTTNEERALPSAFVRRCIVLRILLPEAEQQLINWLVGRGSAHFPDVSAKVLEETARVLAVERRRAIEMQNVVPPGQAEYLDLLRAIAEIASDESAQLEVLVEIAEFALKKTV